MFPASEGATCSAIGGSGFWASVARSAAAGRAATARHARAANVFIGTGTTDHQNVPRSLEDTRSHEGPPLKAELSAHVPHYERCGASTWTLLARRRAEAVRFGGWS